MVWFNPQEETTNVAWFQYTSEPLKSYLLYGMDVSDSLFLYDYNYFVHS